MYILLCKTVIDPVIIIIMHLLYCASPNTHLNLSCYILCSLNIILMNYIIYYGIQELKERGETKRDANY